jgi:hypothetical protein
MTLHVCCPGSGQWAVGENLWSVVHRRLTQSYQPSASRKDVLAEDLHCKISDFARLLPRQCGKSDELSFSEGLRCKKKKGSDSLTNHSLFNQG